MLVFEKPQSGVTIDFTGLTEAEAVAKLMSMNDSLPPHPSTINLNCGPEPEDVDADTVAFALRMLVNVPAGEAIPSGKIEYAKNAGAWFYWVYAIAVVRKELYESVGEDAAIEIMHGEDRTEFHRLRSEKVRWIVRERFGREL